MVMAISEFKAHILYYTPVAQRNSLWLGTKNSAGGGKPPALKKPSHCVLLPGSVPSLLPGPGQVLA